MDGETKNTMTTVADYSLIRHCVIFKALIIIKILKLTVLQHIEESV